MGSAAYMAPEHLLGKPVAASHVYSLGVIAWELLVGARPFDSVTSFALPELQRRGTGDTFYGPRDCHELLSSSPGSDPGVSPVAQKLGSHVVPLVSSMLVAPRLGTRDIHVAVSRPLLTYREI